MQHIEQKVERCLDCCLQITCAGTNSDSEQLSILPDKAKTLMELGIDITEM